MATTQMQQQQILKYRLNMPNGLKKANERPRPSKRPGRTGFSRCGFSFGASRARPAGKRMASCMLSTSIVMQTRAWTPLKFGCVHGTHIRSCFCLTFFLSTFSYIDLRLSSASPMASSAPMMSWSQTWMKRRGTFSGRKTSQIIRQLNSASPVENQCVSVLCRS